MSIQRREFLKTAFGAVALVGSGGSLLGARGASAATDAGLPSTLVWSTYDLGSTGYVEASAMADALGKTYGTRVRLQPSGTSLGRIKPLLERRLDYAWLSDELFFASEAMYEYAAPDVGPQDLRTLLGRLQSYGLAATKRSGVKTMQDIKGKRFAIAKANTSANVKTEAILAFADLSWNDLELVEVPSYSATYKALIEGRADVTGVVPQAPLLRELEASPYGLQWIELDPNHAEGWRKLQQVVPYCAPFQETIGAGLSENAPVWLVGYRYPQIATRAEISVDAVYHLVKAIAQTYDQYKDAAPIMKRWVVDMSGVPPAGAAFHEGAVRYLREAGVWSSEHQQWNERRLERHRALQTAWREMMTKEFRGQAEPERVQEVWLARRAEILQTF